MVVTGKNAENHILSENVEKSGFQLQWREVRSSQLLKRCKNERRGSKPCGYRGILPESGC